MSVGGTVTLVLLQVVLYFGWNMIFRLVEHLKTLVLVFYGISQSLMKTLEIKMPKLYL